MEHSAVPDDAQALPDGFPDGPDLEAEVLDPRRSDVGLWEQSAWDASGGARPDAAADAALPLPALLAGAAVGKLAGPVPVARARDGQSLPLPQIVLWRRALPDGAALCRLAEVQSVEQSCAVQGSTVQESAMQQPGVPDAARSAVRVLSRQRSTEEPELQAALPDAPAVPMQLAPMESEVLPEQQAFPPQAALLPDAAALAWAQQLAPAVSVSKPGASQPAAQSLAWAAPAVRRVWAEALGQSPLPFSV